MTWSRYFAAVVVVVLMIVGSPRTGAVSLKITPLEYRTSLAQHEKKKGFVDISNPDPQAVELAFEVQAFRQIDDQGGIEFYDDEGVTAGILLDLESAELGPREVLRLYFVIDASKLPVGDVYAAVLAHTVPTDATGTAQAVRVGTILEISNGVATNRRSTVAGFSAPFFQVGERISSQFVVHNDSQRGGFRPTVTMAVSPYSTKEVEGPLVFAGRSRTVDYSARGNYFGPVWLQATVQDSSKGQWVFAMTGYWRWLGPLIIISGTLLVGMALYTRHKKH
jgi:hypothetical protein